MKRAHFDVNPPNSTRAQIAQIHQPKPVVMDVIGLRAQILANVEVLTSGASGPLRLVTSLGDDGLRGASVVTGTSVSIQGPGCATTELALKKLLAQTEQKVGVKMKANTLRAASKTVVPSSLTSEAQRKVYSHLKFRQSTGATRGYTCKQIATSTTQDLDSCTQALVELEILGLVVARRGIHDDFGQWSAA